ncbi:MULTISPECIES: L,D-transpeptidase family protein [Thermodesulfovibrio]|jgi:murein L,D-transpeptidase YafK|uniref:L,D-transpeptidase family protein n=1 Tax=Thermodesulfovibrio TaxID=28261 RepID=UPI0026296042|nr:L,D-transpeptidase family protein [Thermodesulfovibrio sp.]
MLLRTLLFSIILFFSSSLLHANEIADLIVVIKSKRVMFLMREGKILKTYRISLGKTPVGKKTSQGDGKTPEGRYYIESRNPNSNFYRALKISYPNETDILNATRAGINPGGAIMIHGLSKKVEYLGKYHIIDDWTEGCIAVTNEEMDEIWKMVPDGIPIEILP